jgi:hypothetical protein
MSTSRKLALGCLMVVASMAVPSIGHAFPACDNFGQDWSITLGPFGGVFPGSLLTTGCRDCDQSLVCGGPLVLDGAAVLTTGTGGAPFSLVWSMTAFKPFGGDPACLSTHWTGSHPGTSAIVNGNVSNEVGPYGPFSLSLGTSCREGAASSKDPSR